MNGSEKYMWLIVSESKVDKVKRKCLVEGYSILQALSDWAFEKPDGHNELDITSAVRKEKS